MILLRTTSTRIDSANHIAVFQETNIRRVWHNDEWWFALSDVIVVLTDSADPKQYIKKMRSRDAALDANWDTTCTPLELLAPDGKMRQTNCANTEGLFRIIQPIPQGRARELYQAKGYPPSWTEKRLRSISEAFGLSEGLPLLDIPSMEGLEGTACVLYGSLQFGKCDGKAFVQL